MTTTHDSSKNSAHDFLQLHHERSEVVFEDYKKPYDHKQAVAEANRCLYCYDAPCIKACPTSINIPEFIRKIATENIKGSAKTIFDSNILGMSCARVCPVEVLCVGDCVLNHMGVPPIQIGKLQRFSTDEAFSHMIKSENHSENHDADPEWKFYEAGPDTGYSVGLIGAGPASLACAHRLRRLGHSVTIYERRKVVGGLNTTGIAPYKMKAERALVEAKWILQIGGIDIKTNVAIPKDISWEDLQAKHDALFIGLGLGEDSRLDIAGDDLSGIYGAVDYIEQLKCGQVNLAGVDHVAVIGGGNTALDAVRELKGLGVQHVSLVYRGGEEHMGGYSHEWDAAKQEGVAACWYRQPVAYTEHKGRVSGIVCAKTDENRRPIAGTEHEIKADLVLLAIGQAKLGEIAAHLSGLVVEKGRIITETGGVTGAAGVFAGGDCANGGKEVVNATAEGRDAALSIDAYLRGRTAKTPSKV